MVREIRPPATSELPCTRNTRRDGQDVQGSGLGSLAARGPKAVEVFDAQEPKVVLQALSQPRLMSRPGVGELQIDVANEEALSVIPRRRNALHCRKDVGTIVRRKV